MLLQGPSVGDRSRITEPLTRTAAAPSQYCFKRYTAAAICTLLPVGLNQDIPIVNRENSWSLKLDWGLVIYLLLISSAPRSATWFTTEWEVPAALQLPFKSFIKMISAKLHSSK